MHPEMTMTSKNVPGYAALALALLLLTAMLPATVGADSGPVDEDNPLDPRQYLSIKWNQSSLVTPCDDDSCPPPWEIVGGRGKLEIEFDRDRMKELWDFDTQGSLSIRGYVDSATKGRRNIEIPGYSLVGTDLTVVDMDLSAAFDLVNQLSQSVLLSVRILQAGHQAELAGLKAQHDAVDQQIQAETTMLNESELALTRIYTEALRFTLSARDVTDAAAVIAKARKAQEESAIDPGAAGTAAKIGTFFRQVRSEHVTLQSWLNVVLADSNRPYLPIVARIVGRSENVIRDVAIEVQGIIGDLEKGELTPEAQDAAMRRMIRLSKIILDIQDNIFLNYNNLSAEAESRLRESPQFRSHIPSSFVFSHVKTSNELCPIPDLEPLEAKMHKPLDIEEIVSSRTADRIQALEALLEKLAGKARYESEVKQEALEQFEKQIRRSLEETKKLAEKRGKLSASISEQERKLKQRNTVFKGCRDNVVHQGQAIESLLMIEIINTLIDGIAPVTLSLDNLDLDHGDRLGIVVSLLPRPKPDSAPPPQLTCEFRVSSFGWSGPRPRVKDVLTFVQADAPDQDFAPRPGVSAQWHFYGKSTKQKSTLRALAPGIGINATFLDFDGQEDTIEVGLGLTVSLFDDLLHFTYGYNLQEELPNPLGNGGGSREYFGIGVSLSQVVDKFKKDDD